MEPQQRDEQLWQLAKKRAGFKRSLAAYFFVNSFLVGVWYFSSGRHSYFWPVWPMLGWGIGVAFHYFEAYHGSKIFSAEDEYEKLKREKNQ